MKDIALEAIKNIRDKFIQDDQFESVDSRMIQMVGIDENGKDRTGEMYRVSKDGRSERLDQDDE